MATVRGVPAGMITGIWVRELAAALVRSLPGVICAVSGTVASVDASSTIVRKEHFMTILQSCGREIADCALFIVK
jgi:hypothetical protein